jgi:hypothetical protein
MNDDKHNEREVSRKDFEAAKPTPGSGSFAFTPKLPDPTLTVDYGERGPGSSQPMPPERREHFRERLRRAARSAGGNALRIFIRRSDG